MWVILKFDKKKLEFMKKNLQRKLNKKCIFYCPKLKIRKQNNVETEIRLLDDYLFCFNEEFRDKNFMNNLMFVRGLKYFLNGYNNSQEKITKFIKKCKQLENAEGYINQNILEIIENKKYKFLSGPFYNQIFSVLQLQKHKINILIGNLKTSINKERYLIYPI